jgi:16S rRNA C967 or C1407 C5-methylase (RsmB/RsmF family)
MTRQEAVHMLPPLFLDVEPHNVFLDMYAALPVEPRSKVHLLAAS